jgi:hypothetical protein
MTGSGEMGRRFMLGISGQRQPGRTAVSIIHATAMIVSGGIVALAAHGWLGLELTRFGGHP